MDNPETNQEKQLTTQGFLRSYRRIVMYEDLNAASSIFGGRLVSWIDEASAIFASCQMNSKRVVTKKISELVFNRPAKLGDMLEIWCNVLNEGTTSLTVQAIVLRKTFSDQGVNNKIEDAEICRCELVFVALDQNGKPKAWH